MAPARVWLLAAVLACVLIARSAGAGAGAGADGEAPAPATIAGFFGCNPLTDKTCRPPGDPSNQEEEGGLGLRMPSTPGVGGGDADGDGDGDDDDELPSFDTHMTILGH